MQSVKSQIRQIINWLAYIPRAAKTLFVETDKQRWAKVAKEVPHWDARNQILAEFIPDGSSVVDLGCGAQTMRRHLKPNCTYQPCDVVQSTPDVILCDFNAGKYPALPKTYDYVICSGVFEFMRDPDSFLSQIRTYGAKIILTYNPYNPKQSLVERMSGGWVNHLPESAVKTMLAKHKFTFRVLHRYDLTPIRQEIIFELLPIT